MARRCGLQMERHDPMSQACWRDRADLYSVSKVEVLVTWRVVAVAFVLDLP